MTVALSAPPDLRAQDDIRAQLGSELELCFAREKDVQDTIKKLYGLGAGTIGEMMDNTPAAVPPPDASYETIENLDNVEKMAGDASIAKLVNHKGGIQHVQPVDSMS